MRVHVSLKMTTPPFFWQTPTTSFLIFLRSVSAKKRGVVIFKVTCSDSSFNNLKKVYRFDKCTILCHFVHVYIMNFLSFYQPKYAIQISNGGYQKRTPTLWAIFFNTICHHFPSNVLPIRSGFFSDITHCGSNDTKHGHMAVYK